MRRKIYKTGKKYIFVEDTKNNSIEIDGAEVFNADKLNKKEIEALRKNPRKAKETIEKKKLKKID